MMSISNQLAPSAFAQIKQACHTVCEALPLLYDYVRNGRPEYVLGFDGGIGDEFLCSALIHELKQRHAGNIWMLTYHPSLFYHNPEVKLVVRKNLRGVNQFLARFKFSTIALSYAAHVNGQDIPPKSHVITALCEKLKLSGGIAKRPYLYLQPGEKAKGVFGPRQLAIQTSGMSAKYAARTKEWFPERFQQLANRFSKDFTIVQIGAAKDPPLSGVVDMRGKTSIRETAGILANSVVFVGLAGFLQHLARSVECRSVIIYGGRELPTQTGYTCNENIVNNPECSPCWIYSLCNYGFKCMEAIGVETVARAVDIQISRFGQPLPIDSEECCRK